tara:strand:+ start:229 stop:666 length:438 start_codon:yes stop_codon:yes gene_type:complete
VSDKKIILCDIDGTIANNDHRQHFLQGKKDWDGFFSELINDEPIFPIINKVIEEHDAGKDIIFLTGRPERYRYSTTLWLKEYFNFELKILMRKDNDQNNKLKVKKEIFEKNFRVNDIDYVIDNDIELLKQWEDMGIDVYEVKKTI